jgi:hypothetical protein
MNNTTPYKSARSYDSEESTVETVLSTVEDKKEEKKKTNLLPVAIVAKYKFLPTLKVPEDIFPHQIKLTLCCDMCATCDGRCDIFIPEIERPGRQVIFCYGLVLS